MEQGGSDERIEFEDILERAALMGLNIGSDEFWEIRPDYFLIMSKAYDIRNQQVWLPFRRLMTVIVASNGGKANDADFQKLPHFDEIVHEEPINLSRDEINSVNKEFERLGLIKT